MAADDLLLDFDPLHSLGFLVTDWIEWHCKVPGGVYEGEPLLFNGWQLFCTANHYRIRPKAVLNPRRLIEPFHYRRSVVVGPQKCGKSPWGAGMLLAEAVGPTLFAGWAAGGEVYDCADHGCGCGWEYEYQPGEAMGVPRRKSLLGLLAYAESQTNNVYEPLQTMILSGPLAEFVFVREGFIRTPNRGKIVPLSSAARSKLGQPLTGALGDESGLYTSTNKVLDTWQTMRRGVAAMQGRTIELTNPWDPMESSAAQQAFESRRTDIFRYHRKPPADLSYGNKRERHKIHVHVYADSPWVNPADIDAEAAELVETDPTQAERFFGNRLVQGRGSFLTEKLWDETLQPVPSAETRVALGFDGSRSNDWTALRLETADGYRFTPTYGPDRRPTFLESSRVGGADPARGGEGRGCRGVQHLQGGPGLHRPAALGRLRLMSGRPSTARMSSCCGRRNAIARMFDALSRFVEDTAEHLTTHSDDETAKLHALAARRVAKAGDRYILGKPSGNQKIDILMADILAHEAAADQRSAGWTEAGPAIFFLPR